MKIFISSTIIGMEDFRDAAARAVRQLGHEVLRVEDFGASHESAQIACLKGVRDADVVLLLLGEQYGAIQSSGLSATHEEYREAKEKCQIFVFIQDNDTRQPKQTDFVSEAQDWSQGQYTAAFHDADTLLDAIVNSLHTFELSIATSPVDSDEMLQRATGMLQRYHASNNGDGPFISLALAGGPQQTILRPTQLEEQKLSDELQQMAMFGAAAILDRSEATDIQTEDDSLVFIQQKQRFSVSEDGSIGFYSLIKSSDDYLSQIIEEDIQECIELFLRFSSNLLSHIDSTNRLSHYVLAGVLINTGHTTWRTRAEQTKNPNSMTMNIYDNGDLEPVSLSPPSRPRAAIKLNAMELANDLTVKFRRGLYNSRRGQ